jgi:hypothetical protein
MLDGDPTGSKHAANEHNKQILIQYYLFIYYNFVVACGNIVVKALCCKPEGHGFKSQWGGFLKLT